MRAPLLDGLTVWPSYLLVYDTQKEKLSRYHLHISNMIFRFQILTKVTFHLQWETVSITFSSYTLIFWKLTLDPQSIWGLLWTIKWVASEGHQTLVIWLRRSDVWTSRRCLFLVHAHIYKGRSRRSCQWMATAENYCYFCNNSCDEKDIEEVVHNCTIFLCSLDVRNKVQGGDPLYAGFFLHRALEAILDQNECVFLQKTTV